MKRLEAVLADTLMEPRPYQTRIVSKALAMANGTYVNGAGETEPPASAILIESPTGSGKTCMGLLAAKMLQEQHGYRIGWMAMRRELLNQVAAENVNKGVNVRDLTTISMFDKTPPTALDVLVVDEAQHDASNSAAHIHNTIKPKIILGLSATPYRTDSVKLCFQKVIKDAGIHQLIQDGYLSRYHHYTLPNWHPETLAEFYAADPMRWGKSLFFFHKRSDCHRLRKLLRRRGLESQVVTGESDRDAQLAWFNEPGNGRDFHRCLINMMVLTEGFDCPNLNTVWVRPSGRGPTIQMGGRVFRKFPGLSHKNVVQSADTRHPFMKTALADQQYLWQNDQWVSLTINPELDRINQRARVLIANTLVEVPKFLSKAKEKRRRIRF